LVRGDPELSISQKKKKIRGKKSSHRKFFKTRWGEGVELYRTGGIKKRTPESLRNAFGTWAQYSSIFWRRGGDADGRESSIQMGKRVIPKLRRTG